MFRLPPPSLSSLQLGQSSVHNSLTTSVALKNSPKSPMRSVDDPDVLNSNLDMMAQQYRAMLQSIGENPDREGLKETPIRAAKAMMFFTKVSLGIGH